MDLVFATAQCGPAVVIATTGAAIAAAAFERCMPSCCFAGVVCRRTPAKAKGTLTACAKRDLPPLSEKEEDVSAVEKGHLLVNDRVACRFGVSGRWTLEYRIEARGDLLVFTAARRVHGNRWCFPRASELDRVVALLGAALVVEGKVLTLLLEDRGEEVQIRFEAEEEAISWAEHLRAITFWSNAALSCKLPLVKSADVASSSASEPAAEPSAPPVQEIPSHLVMSGQATAAQHDVVHSQGDSARRAPRTPPQARAAINDGELARQALHSAELQMPGARTRIEAMMEVTLTPRSVERSPRGREALETPERVFPRAQLASPMQLTSVPPRTQLCHDRTKIEARTEDTLTPRTAEPSPEEGRTPQRFGCLQAQLASPVSVTSLSPRPTGIWSTQLSVPSTPRMQGASTPPPTTPVETTLASVEERARAARIRTAELTRRIARLEEFHRSKEQRMQDAGVDRLPANPEVSGASAFQTPPRRASKSRVVSCPYPQATPDPELSLTSGAAQQFFIGADSSPERTSQTPQRSRGLPGAYADTVQGHVKARDLQRGLSAAVDASQAGNKEVGQKAWAIQFRAAAGDPDATPDLVEDMLRKMVHSGYEPGPRALVAARTKLGPARFEMVCTDLHLVVGTSCFS